MRSASNRRASGGFSLLEMLVAISILALSLGALYQATGGATRNVRADERYAYAVELARSLLATYGEVPRNGLARQGETAAGFLWRVEARPVSQEQGSAVPNGALQSMTVNVSWADGQKRRELALHSVVEGRQPR